MSRHLPTRLLLASMTALVVLVPPVAHAKPQPPARTASSEASQARIVGTWGSSDVQVTITERQWTMTRNNETVRQGYKVVSASDEKVVVELDGGQRYTISTVKGAASPTISIRDLGGLTDLLLTLK